MKRLPEDCLAAIALALQGADNDRTAVAVIQEIVDGAPEWDGLRTEPTKILVDAIHNVGGRFST